MRVEERPVLGKGRHEPGLVEDLSDERARALC